MFYAYHNAYGNGTRNSHGERLGTLHVFATRRERDERVGADEFDGNWHREAVGGREGRRELEALAAAAGMDPERARFSCIERVLDAARRHGPICDDAQGYDGLTTHF